MLPDPGYVSRGGFKLDHALDAFDVDPNGMVCADLGCSVGGFTDCLIQRGAKRVYAVDTGYGVLDWRMRSHDHVVVMERTNALHVELPELCHIITIDASWTRQSKIVPVAAKLLEPGGCIVSLVKPHYEADRDLLVGGVLPDEQHPEVMRRVIGELSDLGYDISGPEESPLRGGKAGNREHLIVVRLP